MTIPVFVISLRRAAERRERMVAHLSQIGITPRIVDGVDGKTLPDDTKKCLLGPGITMHDGTLGCYLSHIAVYETILAEQIPVALVLEDDARLSPLVTRLLEGTLESLDFDYCFLDSDDHNNMGPVFFDPDRSVPLKGPWRAHLLSAGPQTLHAYLITLAGASKRVAHAHPLTRAIDLYDHLPYPITFRALVEPKLAWVSEDSLQSFTSARSQDKSSLNLRWLRRSIWFYRLRDALTLKPLKRWIERQRLQKAGKLEQGPRWRALPAGREIVL